MLICKRYFYIGISVFAIVISAFLLSYRTELPQIAEFGGVSLRIEYATTSEARERGLGGRSEIQKDYGMLFVFPKNDYYGVWMKDMLVPIDIFWLDSKGQVIFIKSDVATSTYPNVFYPTEPARYVLETVSGFARENNISTVTRFLLKDFPIVSE